MSRSRVIIGIVVSMLVVVGIVVGVTQRDSSSLSKNAGSAVARSADDAGRSGDATTLPAFSGTRFGGGTLTNADITGPAIIHVYGSWCPTCQSEAPAFAQLQREHPDLAYYYVAVNDTQDDARKFLTSYGWKSGPIVDDAGRDVESALGLSGQPHTIFVDEDGSISVHRGPGSFGDLDSLARRIA